MGELEQEYGEQVSFNVVPGEETAERVDELEQYNLASRSHGLVALDQAGEAVVTIAGHRFGRSEIELAIAQALQP